MRVCKIAKKKIEKELFEETITEVVTLMITEKAIACLAVCHAVVAIGYVIRLAAGRVNVACASVIPLHSQDQVVISQQQQQYLTQDGLASPYCAVVFLLLYYFSSAANVW